MGFEAGSGPRTRMDSSHPMILSAMLTRTVGEGTFRPETGRLSRVRLERIGRPGHLRAARRPQHRIGDPFGGGRKLRRQGNPAIHDGWR